IRVAATRPLVTWLCSREIRNLFSLDYVMFVNLSALRVTNRFFSDFRPVTTKISPKVWRRPGPALWETLVFLWERSKRMLVNAGSLRQSPLQGMSRRAAAVNAPNFNGHQRYSNGRREAAATRTDLENHLQQPLQNGGSFTQL
ncbi:hypothetical protein TYRP_001801, partial [Tyrophagus putrescentiae]